MAMELKQSTVALEASIDAKDIVRGLNDNDEQVLTFICQMVALADSIELRERLIERLGVNVIGPNGEAQYNAALWSDEEYLP